MWWYITHWLTVQSQLSVLFVHAFVFKDQTVIGIISLHHGDVFYYFVSFKWQKSKNKIKINNNTANNNNKN